MILDNEEQREFIIKALLSLPIQGDYEGIMQMLPKFTAVIEAVKSATVQEEGKNAGGIR